MTDAPDETTSSDAASERDAVPLEGAPGTPSAPDARPAQRADAEAAPAPRPGPRVPRRAIAPSPRTAPAVVVTPTAPRVTTARATPATRPADDEERTPSSTSASARSPRVRKRTRVQRPAGATAADVRTPVDPVAPDAAAATTGQEPVAGAGAAPAPASAPTSTSHDDAVAELRGLLDAAEQAHATRLEREDDARGDSLAEAAHAEGDTDGGSAPAPVAEAEATDAPHAQEDSTEEAATEAVDVEDARPVDGADSVVDAVETEPPATADAPAPRTEQESEGPAAVAAAEILPDDSEDSRAAAADDAPVGPVERGDEAATPEEADEDTAAQVETAPEPEVEPAAETESAPAPAPPPEPARVVTVRTDSLTAPRSPRAGLAGVDETALTPSVRGERAAAPELGDEVLVIAGLTKRFDEKVAVDDVALTVRAGSFYGIVGPNGAGKTTTMSMVTGLLRPDAGTVTVNGIDVWRDPLTAKRSIGVLPDRLRLFDRLTGAQLLHYSGALRGLDAEEIRRRSADLVAAFGLEDAVGRLVTDYSAGMAKKVALACAMIHSPRLLVLDEPFESVDPVSAANVVEILQDYVAHGGTVVLSSHGMDFIQRICDHVAIIVNGRVLAAGTMDEVRAGRTLEERFVALAGGRRTAEGFSWLHSFSD